MGYTHYWSFIKPKRGTAKIVEKRYADAIKQCQLIVSTYSKVNGGIAGYSAHTKPGEYGGLNFNGSRENGHEDFVMRERLKDYFSADSKPSDFCKTAQKPYDVLVVACLIVLQNALPDNIRVYSDGDSSDWLNGLELAKRILKKKDLRMPSTIRKKLVAI